jgi:ribosomal protein L40E
MDLPMKICPRCGEEYVHSAQTCAECGVALGFEAPAEPERLELGPAEGLVALRNAEVPWIEGLAQALAEAGVASRVELPTEIDANRVQGRGTGALRCTLYVRSEDAAAAARVDAAFARTQVPDLPEEADAGWGESQGCPGCGAPLAADAEECGECGLVFAGGE